jgi:hypothetical protein
MREHDMKTMNGLLLAVLAFCASGALAQGPRECGKPGEIRMIEKSGNAMVGFPPACVTDRQNNYAGAPPEAHLMVQAICELARNPKDFYKTGDPLIPTFNMSGCFCYTGEFADGPMTKCWTFYDRTDVARVDKPEIWAPAAKPQGSTTSAAKTECPEGSVWHNAFGTGAHDGGTCYVIGQSGGTQGRGQQSPESSRGSSASRSPVPLVTRKMIPNGTIPDQPVPPSNETLRASNTPRNPTSPAARTTPNGTTPDQSTLPTKGVEWGPLQWESIAVCRKGEKSGMWSCNGALDNQILFDEPTLEGALVRQHCLGGIWAAGGPIIEGKQWDAYRCGHGLGAGDYDVVKRYGLITARRSYMCPLYHGDRCATPYDGQDKR